MTYLFKCVDVYIIDKLSIRKMDDTVIIIRISLPNITIAKSSIINIKIVYDLFNSSCLIL